MTLIPIPKVLAAGLMALSFSASHAVGQTTWGSPGVNDTAEKLVGAIRGESLWSHLVDFQRIADENPGASGHGNRDTGTPGYKASVNYVAGLMREAGYRVTVQAYPYRNVEVSAQAKYTSPGQSYLLNHDWYVARLSAGGSISAPVQLVKGTGSGAVPEEFAGFVPGRIALLQRGSAATMCRWQMPVRRVRRR